MKNHSASPMSAERRIVSPALTNFSPDETIAAAEQDRSAARRTVGQRFGPLLYGLAAFFLVAGPVLGASQADLQPALAQFSQEGSKLVGSRSDSPSKAGPSRFLPTATPPSWAGLLTTGSRERRGSIPAAMASGPSKASWPAPARLEAPDKVGPSRCPTTARPPSWAGLLTPRTLGRRGSSPAAMVFGPRQQAGRQRCGWRRQTRRLRRIVRRRQHRHRGRAF